MSRRNKTDEITGEIILEISVEVVNRVVTIFERWQSY